jgi:hypothetical protein
MVWLFNGNRYILPQIYTSLNCNYAFTVATTKKQEEISVFVQRIESLKTDLEIEQQQGASLRQKLESATKVEQEKIKLQKEVR